jgi:hypothetical protein
MTYKLYFVYVTGCGGLGDFIKGASTTWFLAKKLGREFECFIQHPLNEYYTLKDKQDHKSMRFQIVRALDIKTSEKVVEMIQNKDQDVGLICNTVLDHFTLYPDYKEQITPFIQDFYTDILKFEHLPLLHPKFQVLHCRMGDKYLYNTPDRTDNRIKSLELFAGQLKYFIDNLNTMPTLICCDSQEYQQFIHKKVPNSWIVQDDPIHFSYKTPGVTEERLQESTLKTIQEHELTTHAQRIIMFAYSGFPFIASKIGNVPLFKLTPTGLEDYDRPVW